MQEQPKKYTRLGKLGEGTYGVVFKAQEEGTGKIVAMKYVKVGQEVDGISPSALREISILKTVSHPNIIALENAYVSKDSVVLVMEYENWNLRQLLRKRTEAAQRPLRPELAKSYAFQILCGIFTLYTHRIMHRDMKPENILLDTEGNLKIGDFGLSRYFTLPLKQYTPEVVSTWYRPPELLFGNHWYDLSIDLWAVGCMIAEMIRGPVLFKGDCPSQQLRLIVETLGTPRPEDLPNYAAFLESGYKGIEIPKKPWEEVLGVDDPHLIDLIGKILVYDPAKRITTDQALRHPYFASIPPQIRNKCWPPGLRE